MIRPVNGVTPSAEVKVINSIFGGLILPKKGFVDSTTLSTLPDFVPFI
jgi:hypothetical protein